MLRLIARRRAAARAAERGVAVCGGLASDPAAVPLLVGLGVRELSAVPGAIPRIKARVRTAATRRVPRRSPSARSRSTAPPQVRALLARARAERVRGGVMP